MPRYFFDIRDGSGHHPDSVGIEFEDMDAAIAEARRALAEMAHETLSTDSASPLEIIIRDGADGPVRLAISIITERPA